MLRATETNTEWARRTSSRSGSRPSAGVGFAKHSGNQDVTYLTTKRCCTYESASPVTSGAREEKRRLRMEQGSRLSISRSETISLGRPSEAMLQPRQPRTVMLWLYRTLRHQTSMCQDTKEYQVCPEGPRTDSRNHFGYSTELLEDVCKPYNRCFRLFDSPRRTVRCDMGTQDNTLSYYGTVLAVASIK